MPASNATLTKLYLDGSCNFDSDEAVVQLGQLLHDCQSSLEEISLTDQRGDRKVNVRYIPLKKGFFFDDKPIIDIYDRKTEQKLKSITLGKKANEINIINDPPTTWMWLQMKEKGKTRIWDKVVD